MGLQELRHDLEAFAITEACSEYFGIPLPRLVSGDRHKSVTRARGAALYIIRYRCRRSLPELGALFDRHHTTVRSMIRTIHERRRSDVQLDSALHVLMQPSSGEQHMPDAHPTDLLVFEIPSSEKEPSDRRIRWTPPQGTRIRISSIELVGEGNARLQSVALANLAAWLPWAWFASSPVLDDSSVVLIAFESDGPVTIRIEATQVPEAIDEGIATRALAQLRTYQAEGRLAPHEVVLGLVLDVLDSHQRLLDRAGKG